MQDRRLAAVVGAQGRRAAARPRPPAGTSRSTSAASRVDARRRAGGRRAGPAGRASPTAARSTGRPRPPPARPRSAPALVCDRASPRRSRRSRSPLTSTPSTIRAPAARALSREAEHRLLVEGEAAACSCRQTVRPSRAPVGVQLAHVRARPRPRRCAARTGSRSAAGARRPRPGRAPGRRPERDVAATVVVEGLRVGLPDLDAGGHQLLHRRLEVVVADHAAGDPRRAGPDRRLVDARAPPRRPAPGATPSRGRGRQRRRPGGGRSPAARGIGVSAPAAPSPRARAASSPRRRSASPRPRGRARAGRTWRGPP